MWSARVHLSRGPAPRFLSRRVGSRILAIVVSPRVARSPTCSLYTRFANAQPRRLTSSLFVHRTMISASLIPARRSESRESAFPVTKRQSRDCDSLIATGSGSIRATCLFSALKEAATPLPTSPAPAIMTRILRRSFGGAAIIMTSCEGVNESSEDCEAIREGFSQSSSKTLSPRTRSTAARSWRGELLRVRR